MIFIWEEVLLALIMLLCELEQQNIRDGVIFKIIINRS